MKEGRLEARNGEAARVKKWRASPDPKVPYHGAGYEPEPVGVVQSGGRLERLGRALDDQALLQWRENKVGLGLAAAFVVAALLLTVGW